MPWHGYPIPRHFLYVSVVIVIVAAGAIAVAAPVRGEEFVNGEFNALEGLAWILRCAVALSVRNTEIVCRNCHLNITLNLNN